MKFLMLLIIQILAIISSANASACPEFLMSLRSTHLPSELPDLCTAYDRYHAALEKIEAQGVSPATRIADLHARRLINGPHWEEVKANTDFDVWSVYEPAPLTWQRFEESASYVDTIAEKNLAARKLTPISFRNFFKTHIREQKDLNAKAGILRRSGEAGLSIHQANALTSDQSTALQNLEYGGLVHPGVPLIKWHPTQCLEDRTPEFIKTFNEQWPKTLMFYSYQWPDIQPNSFFTDAGGAKKQCGYMIYSEFDEVRPQLKKWLKDINSSISTWGTQSPSGDPVLVAARAQKWLISIHPFTDGNGRISRLMMDLILRSLGLPSPALADQDQDVYTSETASADEVGRGLLRSIKIVEKCAADPRLSECRIVPRVPATLPK
jgi:hypothetical protein